VNSTLTIIDGLRTTNYPLADDGERGFVDLNSISESIIDRVEVLKDGASSIYGADAIGGVVNLIIKPTFQGEEAEAEGGVSQHGGGTMERVAVTVGHGNLDEDRYNAYLNFEYQHDDSINVGQRGFPFNTNDLTSIGGNNNNWGNPSHLQGSIYGSVTPGDATGAQIPGSLSQILAPAGCGPKGLTTTDPAVGTFCLQNQALYGDDQPRETRFGFYGRFTVQLNPQTRAYVSTSYYQNDVYVNTTPSQIQTSTPNNTDAIFLPSHLANGSLNPNDPFAALGQTALINYAFGDIPAFTHETNHVFRSVMDLKGTAFDWDYDLSGVVAHAWLNSLNAGFINFAALNTDIATGAYSFVDPASNTAAVRAALSPHLSKVSTTDLDAVNFFATHPLWQLPGGPLNLALGGAFRYEATNDPDLNPSLAAQGLGIAHTVGERTVASGFFELDAPVIRSVDINLSGRFDHYSDFGNNFSPKIGIKWTPFKEFALRGTYSQGFRAPSFSESGQSASEGFTTFTLPNSFIAAHGGDGYTNPYPVGFITAANPNLKPEVSESFTAGFVVEPNRYLSGSVDFYWVKKRDVIAAASPVAALDAYFAGQPIPAGFAVTPDIPDSADPTGLARPVSVAAPYVNANSLVTDGVDADIRFTYPLPWYDIKFTSDFDVTDIFGYWFDIPGQGTQNYVGTQSPYILSSGAGTPKWKAAWTNSITSGPLTVTGTLYWTSGIKMEVRDITGAGVCFSTNNATGDNFPANCATKDYFDFDLTGSYKVNDKLEVYANILNLFDATPPLDPIDYAGINYSPTYAQSGIVGRYFKIGVRVRY
jgi:iron complex outermembrane receptor protein